MPGSTPIYGFPYPIGTDPVRNGDNEIAGLALAVENEIATYGTWTSFTPSWTNFTVGNATQDAAYTTINNTVMVEVRVTLGSTSAMGSNPTMTHPASLTAINPVTDAGGQLWIRDATGPDNVGSIAVGATSASLTVWWITATYVRTQAVSATVPFTWAVSDQFRFRYSFRI